MGNTDSLHQTTLFFEEGTDEAIAYNLVTEREQHLLFILNALFFDNITMGITDLLSNPNLFKLWEKDRAGMEWLFAHTIRPQLFELNDAMDAYNAMEKDTIIHLPGDTRETQLANLRKHAKYVNRWVPKGQYLKGDYCGSKSAFRQNAILLINQIVSDSTNRGVFRIPPVQDGLALKNANAIAFRNWITKLSPDQFDNTVAMKWLDQQSDLKDDDKKVLRLMLHTAQQYARSAATTDSQFMSNGILDEFLTILVSSPQRDEKGEHKREEKMEISHGLTVNHVVALNLSNVIDLRDQEPFVDIRRLLTTYRTQNGRLSDQDNAHLAVCLTNCAKVICAQITKPYLHNIRKFVDNSILRIERSTTTAEQRGLEIILNRIPGATEIKYLLGRFASRAAIRLQPVNYAGKLQPSAETAPMNTSTARYKTDKPLDYIPAEGSFRQPPPPSSGGW
jgi:hypothetical protein